MDLFSLVKRREGTVGGNRVSQIPVARSAKLRECTGCSLSLVTLAGRVGCSTSEKETHLVESVLVVVEG